MITDTKEGQTNYCPNCEDQARRIEELEAKLNTLVEICTDAGCEDWIDLKTKLKSYTELERRERMLVETLHLAQIASCSCLTKTNDISYHSEHCLYRILGEAINATPSHSAAWEWNQHVEWMNSQPKLWMTKESKYRLEQGGNCKGAVPVHNKPSATAIIPLVAIPELKEVKE